MTYDAQAMLVLVIVFAAATFLLLLDRFYLKCREVSELEESFQQVKQESTARQLKLLNQDQVIRELRESESLLRNGVNTSAEGIASLGQQLQCMEDKLLDLTELANPRQAQKED